MGARAPLDGVRDGLHGLVLADDAAVQLGVEVQQLLALARDQLADRDAGPHGDDVRDVLLRHLLAQHALGVARLRSRTQQKVLTRNPAVSTAPSLPHGSPMPCARPAAQPKC